MAAKKTQADETAAADNKDEVKGSANGVEGQGAQTTTTDVHDNPPAEDVEKVDDEEVDNGFESEAFDGGSVSGSLGTVSERGTDGDYDVPWKYLDNNDLEELTSVRTSDSDDPERSWSVQDYEGEGDNAVPVALVPRQSVPGQTFHVSELPDVEVMEAAGINSRQLLAGLPVRGDLGDKEVPRRGIPA